MSVSKSRRDFLQVLALGSGAALLAACGQAAPSPTAAPKTEAKPAESKPAESKPAAAKPADTKPAEGKPAAQAPGVPKGLSGEVVWYSTAPQTALDAVAKRFNEAHPGLTMKSLFNRAPELAQKVEAEAAAGKGVASIIMVPSPVILYTWRDKGVLMEYKSPEEKAYPDWFVESGWWIGARVLDVLLAYNTRLVTDLPKEWDVIADPKYKGKLSFPDAGTLGGPPLLWYKMLKEKYGPDFWPKVVANEPKIVEQTGQALDMVINGEAAFGEMYGYDILTALQKNASAPAKPVWLAPTPITYAANALLKGSPNPDAAKYAYDWLASKAGQQAIVDANNTLSARDDVDLGPTRVKLSQLTWAKYDIRAYAKEENDLKAEWKQVFKRS